jgi:hypothetical protein
MANLNPDALSVTSFETTSPTLPGTVSADCVSPLCMTEGRECTTPWCKGAAEPVGVGG